MLTGMCLRVMLICLRVGLSLMVVDWELPGVAWNCALPERLLGISDLRCSGSCLDVVARELLEVAWELR